MKRAFLVWGIGVAAMAAAVGEENSTQRLEGAQQGLADASWPKKPDNRISPLSGKMKDMATLAPRYYGEGRELSVRRLDSLQKETPLARQPAWTGSAEWGREEVRWEKATTTVDFKNTQSRFQPGNDEEPRRWEGGGEVSQKAAPDWSSRSARAFSTGSASLRMYEGRLTRVREQVQREEAEIRDLGPDRREKFKPEEVERMLSQPVGEFRENATERSRSASPLAAAGN